MPELPEVETIARTLAPDVCGKCIVHIRVLEPRSWQGAVIPQDVTRSHPRICAVSRRGKLLLLHFGHAPAKDDKREASPPSSSLSWPHGYTQNDIFSGSLPVAAEDENHVTGLAFHLRMTGGLFTCPKNNAQGKHTRLVFEFDDDSQLIFNDTRKFGGARALSGRELKNWPFWQTLGPDPLELTDEDFVRRFHSSRQIKGLLLDQKVIAGVGNIYAAESLFAAGIHPEAQGSSLSPAKLKKLHRCLVDILLQSIRECGSTISDYRNARGDAGAFQNRFRVYGRDGQRCFKCGSMLRLDRIGGRSTVWCPKCQKRSGS